VARLIFMTHLLDDETNNPFEIAQEAADQIRKLSGVEAHHIALTLGSGWARAADLIGETVSEIPASEVIGFSKPALAGHVGNIRSIRLPNGKFALVIGARTHFYENHGVRAVVHSVRTAAKAGAKVMVLTNGARRNSAEVGRWCRGSDLRSHQPDSLKPYLKELTSLI